MLQQRCSTGVVTRTRARRKKNPKKPPSAPSLRRRGRCAPVVAARTRRQHRRGRPPLATAVRLPLRPLGAPRGPHGRRTDAGAAVNRGGRGPARVGAAAGRRAADARAAVTPRGVRRRRAVWPPRCSRRRCRPLPAGPPASASSAAPTRLVALWVRGWGGGARVRRTVPRVGVAASARRCGAWPPCSAGRAVRGCPKPLHVGGLGDPLQRGPRGGRRRPRVGGGLGRRASGGKRQEPAPARPHGTDGADGVGAPARRVGRRTRRGPLQP